jgi:subtilisin family serine protease
METQAGRDFFLVEGSKDRGVTWKVLDSGSQGSIAWSGSTGNRFLEWVEFIYLDHFDGVRRFDLRLRLMSDGSGRRDGTYVDDVVLHCFTGSHGNDDFVRFDGTSMAAPHVAGVAALMLAAFPGATTSQLKAALLQGTDALASLDGKVLSGGRLNARAALDALDVANPAAPG